jgi:hypothetical protein
MPGTPDDMAGSGRLQKLPAATFGLPLLLREAAGQERHQLPGPGEQDEEESEKYPVLLCRACGHVITSDDQRVQVAGSHQHTFFNPVGIVYELGCFANAVGCHAQGEASSEFAWFSGYLWRIALCARCGSHLGWRFESAETRFYGLILSMLQGGQR